MRYNNVLDLNNKNNSYYKILTQIRKNSLVLEFGSAHGIMTKYLKQELNCEVFIVELEYDAYSIAIEYAKDGIQGDILELQWLQKFKNIRFDYIIFADVLEHLYNPGLALKSAGELLKDDGTILLSLPNIAHNDILINLYYDSFCYTKWGLLDETHIRFFAKNELYRFCEKNGYRIAIEDCVLAKPFKTEQNRGHNLFDEDLIRALSKRPYGNVYQFVLTLKKNTTNSYSTEPEKPLISKFEYNDNLMNYSSFITAREERHKMLEYRGKGKKVIGWGAGSTYTKNIGKLSLNVEYLIDSNPNLTKSQLDGKEIYQPNILISENIDDVYIIVFASIKAYNQISIILKDMGMLEGKHYDLLYND